VLTLKRCREILGAGYQLTDEELEALRDQLYVIAEVALDAFSSQDEPESECGAPNDEAASC
jgi:hypothetical protein